MINIILGFQTKIITIQDQIIKVDQDANKNGWTDTTDDKINDLVLPLADFVAKKLKAGEHFSFSEFKND